MLQPGSRLIRFLTAVCDLMILNILLVLSCVTVVFSGDGVVSLYTVTLRMFRGTEDSPGKSFLRALRGNFIPSVPSTLLLLADVTMIAVLRRVLYAETLLLSPTVFVLLTIITIFLTALLSYLFPLTARKRRAPCGSQSAGYIPDYRSEFAPGHITSASPAAAWNCGRILAGGGIFGGGLDEFVLLEQDFFANGVRRISYYAGQTFL